MEVARLDLEWKVLLFFPVIDKSVMSWTRIGYPWSLHSLHEAQVCFQSLFHWNMSASQSHLSPLSHGESILNPTSSHKMMCYVPEKESFKDIDQSFNPTLRVTMTSKDSAIYQQLISGL